MVEKLQTVDVETLLSTPLPKTLYIVEGLIPQGVNIVCGDGKIGKSWLMLWLGIQVSKGLPVWGFATKKCDVLYLALEDPFSRLQERLFRLTENAEAPLNFRLAIMSSQIGIGLEEQLQDYLNTFPNTKLIMIDTLQKVRDGNGTTGKNGMYGNDYDDISYLKRIADKNGVAIILVHHLRKLKDSNNPFNQISGSTGIMGAVDTAYLLKRQPDSPIGTFIANGRDIGMMEITLRFEDLIWKLVEVKDQEMIEKEAVPSFLLRLVDYLSENDEWVGTATELLDLLHDNETNPNMVTKSLTRFTYDFLADKHIKYSSKRTNTKRLIKLKRSDDSDNGDAKSSAVTPVTPVTEKT